jgi:2-(1,2-epoxy-1,2-dihydrophenyl)acetyl-CoA isomerase
MQSSILFERDAGVGRITLNRPDKLNAFNREMCVALLQQLEACAQDQEVRAVYLSGAGNAFSAGQDLAEVLNDGANRMNSMLSETYNPIVSRIRSMDKPVLAAVNGVAAGAGANIALCCDVVVASKSAFFLQAFSKIGLIPDSGGTFFLPRLVGWQRALALSMLGDRVPASEALTMGMLYKVFEDPLFADSSMELARKLSALPTRALALTKQAFNRSMHNNLEDQLLLEEALQDRAVLTTDFQEGIQAFLEKRPPQFKGR